MKKIIKALALVTLLNTIGCTQADTVRHNIRYGRCWWC